MLNVSAFLWVILIAFCFVLFFFLFVSFVCLFVCFFFGFLSPTI